MRQVVIYRGENGCWVVECPSLPGCVSQGETLQQAIVNIKEAIIAYVDTIERRRPARPLGEERFETPVIAV